MGGPILQGRLQHEQAARVIGLEIGGLDRNSAGLRGQGIATPSRSSTAAVAGMRSTMWYGNNESRQGKGQQEQHGNHDERPGGPPRFFTGKPTSRRWRKRTSRPAVVTGQIPSCPGPLQASCAGRLGWLLAGAGAAVTLASSTAMEWATSVSSSQACGRTSSGIESTGSSGSVPLASHHGYRRHIGRESSAAGNGSATTSETTTSPG